MLATQPWYPPPRMIIERAVVSMAMPYIGGIGNNATTTISVPAGWAIGVQAPEEAAWNAAFASDAFAAMVAEARAEIAAGHTEPSPDDQF